MDIYDEMTAEHFEKMPTETWDGPMVFLETNFPGASLEQIVRIIPASTLIIADPVSVAKSRRLNQVLDRLFAFFPNREEAQAITEIDTSIPAGVEAALENLHQRGVKVPVITMGAEGVCIRMTSGSVFLSAPYAKVKDVTGAGDALIAGFIHGYQLYADVEHAIELGLTVAAMTTETQSTVSQDINATSVMEKHRVLWGG
jgi:pseudouridine kinase